MDVKVPPYDYQSPTAPPSYESAVGLQPVNLTPEQFNGPTIITTVIPLGSEPTHIVCPYCFKEINTETRTEPGVIAYVSGFLIALIGCWAGCCLIPCCIDECMDVHHSCPYCDRYLGKFQRK